MIDWLVIIAWIVTIVWWATWAWLSMFRDERDDVIGFFRRGTR